MKKIVIIPAYNEEESIVNTVRDIRENAKEFDYIIINDCSKDNTLKICRENGLNVLDLPVNLGIGGAVQTGYMYAYKHGYELAVQFDGDGQHEARYLNEMAEIMQRENVDMLIGSRFINNEGFQSSGIRRMGINFFASLMKILFGQRISDSTSGMRMCNRKVMKNFIDDYPRDYPEPETTARLLHNHFKIKEIPVQMRERQCGVSSISPGKSIYYMVKVTLAILIEKMR